MPLLASMVEPATAEAIFKVITRSLAKVVSIAIAAPLVAPVPAVPIPRFTGAVLEFHCTSPWASIVPPAPVVIHVRTKSTFKEESTKLAVGAVAPVSRRIVPPVPPYFT